MQSSVWHDRRRDLWSYILTNTLSSGTCDLGGPVPSVVSLWTRFSSSSRFCLPQLRSRAAWWVQGTLAVGPFSALTTIRAKSKGFTTSASHCCTTPGVTTPRWGAVWPQTTEKTILGSNLFCHFSWRCGNAAVRDLFQQQLNAYLDMFLFRWIF